MELEPLGLTGRRLLEGVQVLPMPRQPVEERLRGPMSGIARRATDPGGYCVLASSEVIFNLAYFPAGFRC
ncbi:hypothetical protein [Sciscionella marina]|uniref:hypothetical protein n=1 Tax=Sciscionella marina TaxID=508770 RepID=UPI00039B014A|nr:hypothetical protein [Sciscionella marina]